MGDCPQARKIRLGTARTFTHNGRCRGVNGYAANVCFTPNSGHKWLCLGMSAYDLACVKTLANTTYWRDIR